MTWPPPVTWPGVVEGNSHAFVAVPHGSPASIVPLLFESAQPVM
ncbi:MAG: hypothetical protein QOG93_1688, partial [Gaiellaceae bacterium]|nr:hypothetical protein [Gaiellaceae bacterium]